MSEGRAGVPGLDSTAGKLALYASRSHLRLKEKTLSLNVEHPRLMEMAEVITAFREVRNQANGELEREHFIDSPVVDVIMMVVIFLNALVLSLETDLADEDSREAWWVALEILFCIIFVAEVVVKVRCHTYRWIYQDAWNLLTTAVAGLSVLDAAVLQHLGNTGGKLRLVSLLRIFMMLRLLRIVRHYRELHELKILMQGLLSAAWSLAWVAAMVIFVVFVAAVWTTSLVGHSDQYVHYMKYNPGWDLDMRFGSVGRSMFTLLQCMTLDGWSADVARPVIERHWTMGFFFVALLMLLTYGLLNIIVGIMVEQLISVTKANERQETNRQERKRLQDLQAIRDIFMLVDVDSSGFVDLPEYLKALKDPEVRWRMKQLELPIDEAARLFHVVDGKGTRSLTLNEFVRGCSKLKGPALSKDLLSVQAQAETMAANMDSMNEELKDMERMLSMLEDLTRNINQRFGPSMQHARLRAARRIGSTAPIQSALKDPKTFKYEAKLSTGNCPELPQFPDLDG